MTQYFKDTVQVTLKTYATWYCSIYNPVSQRIWTPRSKSVSGYGPPSADLNPPTKLNENIILNFLVKMDDTLRSNAY